jgi:cell division control protein 6
MADNPGLGIVLDHEILSETYVPPVIRAGEQHISEIRRCLSPALMGQKPMTVWLHGSPGTGKTTAATHVLCELREKAGVPGLCVNCWKHNSFYSVLEHILNRMRRGFGDARDTSVRLAQFEKLVNDRPFIIVLDEVDLMPVREKNDAIYNLYSTGKTGLVLISESRHSILTLEERITSRLNPRLVSFEPYSSAELLDILSDRAARALHPGSCDPGLMELIARKAQGDARIAIHTLRNAALCADAEKAARISQAHVRKGYSDTRHLKRTYELKRLSEHHGLLYRLVMNRAGITSPELFRAYLAECESKDWKPVASRTFSLYMQKMAGLRLIRAERARVKGRVYSFRPVEYP